MTKTSDSVVRSFIDQHEAAFLADLGEWLRIPSVGADPERAGDVRRSAEWLVAKLRETGFPVAEVWESDGLPAVFAEWPSGESDAPTVLLYGHHDVQPAAKEDGWDTEPFEPVVVGNRLYARGAADDKGQVFFHTLGLRAHLAATGRTAPAVNLKLLIEGEEESGSPHFGALLRREAHRLAADLVFVSDTGMWSESTPTVCTGMRGKADCQIDLFGPLSDIHSGSFGGAVPNPATTAAELAAALHDGDRRVAVPGFYDGVIELTERERELFAKLPFDEAGWLATAKSQATQGEAGYSTLERVWARPTAEVNGIWGGYTGPGSKTIVPAAAHLKISFRLVAGQDPERVERAVADWVAGQLPAGIRHEINFRAATRPCLTPLDHPALRSTVRAMERAFEQEILFTREGGSGPAADLQDVLGAPVLFLGISVPSDGWHSVNEKVELDLLRKGVEVAAHLWGDLAENYRPAAGNH
ncbi:dipeptidase [Kitasatospora sp. NBC_01287]|uniref:dipeptidase n=1 Tax=Kitasatospora sp. NBC_01287 TaxID=2903573 RepID=UPI0022586524|nr:dipeptidase [Kitasatospora sp. NBC_01287]MCX4746876.1 dipeptidase [Kitasatospora sp. NBC_01287]